MKRPRLWHLLALSSFLVISGVGVALSGRLQAPPESLSAAPTPTPAPVEDSLLPPHQEPAPQPPAVAEPAPPPEPPPPPPPKPARPARAIDLNAYRGLGAWIDVYDYELRDQIDPVSAVDEMASRGVKTLFLQTSRWKEPNDFVNSEDVVLFLDRAAKRGIAVVGWYLPGFGDLDRDIRRSLAVLQFATPSGNRFAGFAADIETREEVASDLIRFNNGIAEYSRRLREAVGPGETLAAIVVDAKNNERSPLRWLGFPWEEIGRHYDIVMPMAYWTVRKSSNCGLEMDATGYIAEVVEKTKALMGTSKPMHVIGGIADCATQAEIDGYVNATKAAGSVGGSLYDFGTTESSPGRDSLWTNLSAFNH
jgi:hypothetical protein